MSDPSAASVSTPTPLFHHPVVALSLVLVAACGVQVAVWLVNLNLRLAVNRPNEACGPAVHGYLFEAMRACASKHLAEEPLARATFIAGVISALSSSLGWYLVGRMGIGRAWALWIALLWVVHPAFAFLVQRPGPLTLMMPLVPACLALLVWWRDSQKPAAAASAGVLLGAMALLGIQSLLLLPIVLLAILVSRAPRRARLRAGVLIPLGFTAAVAAGIAGLQHLVPPAGFADALRTHLILNLDDGASPVAIAARQHGQDLPLVQFLAKQIRRSPGVTLRWFADRLGRGFYATADGKLQRPLFVMQLALVVPAAWGAIVALGYRPWRWTALLCGLFVLTFWFSAGLFEPLARNIVPPGGGVIILALIGMADGYERLFGRRLTEPESPSKSVARRSSGDYNLTRLQE